MRLQTKIILTVVAIVIILNTIFYSINIYNQKIDSYARLITKIEKNGDILNTISSVALYNFQRPILEANLESFFRDPELCSIELVDKVGAINLKYMKCDPRGYNTITKQTSLFYEGDYLGEIITIYITDIIDKNTSKAIINLLISMFIITIILSIILFLLIRIIVKPINELTILSLEISEGNLDKDININSRDEIGTLTKSFIKMRDSIKEKNRDLEKNKEELEDCRCCPRDKYSYRNRCYSSITPSG
ncbi:MAG: hypothetical protein B6229_05755 [Spirochaetaceae bacterium 4572_7]|nr:MAG: hypothetical protein B6229_05755 [Spirochaetaceae bacterium 4572_7]